MKTFRENEKMLVTSIFSFSQNVFYLTQNKFQLFLAHLSTTCSRGAFRVVMCPSCVVRFFKHLLLPNLWSNLDQTWQECSLEGPLQKLCTEFDSIKNSGCHGNEIEFFKQFFKNLLLWNRWSDFEIISQECFLGDLFEKLFPNFYPFKNMALVNGGFLHYTDIKKFLKNLLLRNFWSDFEINSQECSLGDNFQKLFAKF